MDAYKSRWDTLMREINERQQRAVGVLREMERAGDANALPWRGRAKELEELIAISSRLVEMHPPVAEPPPSPPNLSAVTHAIGDDEIALLADRVARHLAQGMAGERPLPATGVPEALGRAVFPDPRDAEYPLRPGNLPPPPKEVRWASNAPAVPGGYLGNYPHSEGRAPVPRSFDDEERDAAAAIPPPHQPPTEEVANVYPFAMITGVEPEPEPAPDDEGDAPPEADKADA